MDILEPHGDYLADHLAKAKGMAHYARKHGEHFRRVEMMRFIGSKPERLNMQDDKIRTKVLNAANMDQIDELYDELG